jgi:hypothetical protein
MAFHVACARVATCRATQALSSSWVAPAQALVRAGFHRAHPFTGLRVRLLGPGVSLGLHSAEIDAVMMRGYDRVASRFAPDSALRMPGIPVGLADREEIRARGERVPPTISSTTRLRQVTCTLPAEYSLVPPCVRSQVPTRRTASYGQHLEPLDDVWLVRCSL